MTSEPQVITIFVLTAVAFALTIAWTPILTNFLYRHRLGKQIRTDQAPVFSALHLRKTGTPTMGGVLIWGTTLVLTVGPWFFDRILGWTFWHRFNFLTRGETLLPLGALVAASLVGLLDDLYNDKRRGADGGGLRVRERLIIYSLIAVIGAWWFVVKLSWTTIHVPFVGNFDIGWWYFPIFAFIIVATSHSVNVADGLDGLAGGLLLSAFTAFGAIAFVQERFFLAAFCAVIVGSLLAFLWFNIHPARFFMGDTGSMGLGTTLGVVAMLTNAALFLPVIGVVFVLESASVIVQLLSKRMRKKKVFASAPLHHHFEAIGWPEPKVVMRFWIISAVMAVTGFILFLVDANIQ